MTDEKPAQSTQIPETVAPVKPTFTSRLRLFLWKLISLILLIGLVVAIVLWKPWQAQVKAGDRTVTVTGNATITAEPDEFVFYPSYSFTNVDRQTALGEMPARSDDMVAKIKALGVRLAIDDFGTGYSSLAYLRRFPVDIIKIDKSFVDDVVDEPTAAALTHGIIQLGRALQLSTVAEGIEHAGQLTSLAGGNCELGQGYYFAEPLPRSALDDLLFPAHAPGE